MHNTKSTSSTLALTLIINLATELLFYSIPTLYLFSWAQGFILINLPQRIVYTIVPIVLVSYSQNQELNAL